MRRGKGRNGLLPNSLRIISSCLKTVSTNAGSVASTVAASISSPAEVEKDQVLWVGFDKLELGPSSFKHVLLLGYSNGFQVLDVEDACDVRELVSKRDGPVTFLYLQPIPATTEGNEGFKASHPLLLVVAGDETNGSGMVQGGRLSALIGESSSDCQPGNCISIPTVVRFFSLKSLSYVHVLRFRSAVYIVRSSPRIVAVALAAQIYCFDAVTLENKFSLLTYPMPGLVGVNIGYGPMAVGPRWLAYASNNPLLSSTGRLSPQNLTPSPGVSPSTSPGSGSLVARYAMESSKQLAAGIINLGDVGYRTLSKYCQDLLPDGSSSPLSANSSRKVGGLPPTAHPSEVDYAGMVVIKDFVSKDVISQFRAHTSPISALCFDPSGTLLVTASIHGHNINVFRIMPSFIRNGSSSTRYDWTSSHIHLYKLYRGLTTAVIQDICFSHYSQWIAIVSSRGTCHIFVLSPFGGDAGLQAQISQSGRPILIPSLTSPWWSSSSGIMDLQCLPPPPPITLSVVSRIKNGNSGWLSSVSYSTASAAGKVFIPSGAIAASFHNSICHNFLPVQPKENTLEHLLVYSPSGYMIQHELLPSSVAESCDGSSRTGSGPLLLIQDEELHVNAEPVQWWDVCRRLNWPEREENISRIFSYKQATAEVVMDTSDREDNGSGCSVSSTGNMSGNEFIRISGRPHWYLSNAEVQVSSGRIPAWQKPKVSGRFANDSAGGEIEIEKLHVHEVEIRRKCLLPVFEHFQSTQSYWNNGSLAGGRCQGSCQVSSSDTKQAGDSFIKDSAIRHYRPQPLVSGSDVGSCEDANSQSAKSIPHGSSQNLHPLIGHFKIEEESIDTISTVSRINACTRMASKTSDQDCASFRSEHDNCEIEDEDDFLKDRSVIDGLSSSTSSLSFVVRPVIQEPRSSNNSLNSEVPNTSSPIVHSKHSEPADSHNAFDFTQYFHEGYCKVLELDDCRESTEAVTDLDRSSSHCEREKPDEYADNDDMLGGMFAFCEEG